MQIQPPLLQPSQEHTQILPIISQYFIYKGIETNISLYYQMITIQNYFINQTLPLKMSMMFQIISETNSNYQALKIYVKQQQCMEFIKYNWINQNQNVWQAQLLKIMNRKKFHEFFKVQKKIGVGNFASVYQAIRFRDNEHVAVKAFKKCEAFQQPSGYQAVYNQIKIMRAINSPNVAKLYGVYQTQKSLYLVQQFVQGRNLANYIKKYGQLSCYHRKQIIKGLLHGLSDLNNKNVLHRDLKPQNIIYDGYGKNSLKIVDFGLATFIDQPSYIFKRCGTPGYVAPQIITINDNEAVRFNTISDIFSIGSVFYYLIFNKPLFNGKNNIQILQKNKQCNLRQAITLSMKASISKYDLLIRMLATDPNQRIKIHQALQHPFLREQNMLSSKNKINVIKNQQKVYYPDLIESQNQQYTRKQLKRI